MAHPSEPLPLFSPTQVATSNSEQVLHSIFSPNLQGGVTSFKTNSKRTSNIQKRQQEKRERIAQAAQRITPKTPTIKKVSIKTQPPPELLPATSQQDEFFSPLGHNAAPFIPATLSKPVLKTPANLARSAFRSPLNADLFASPLSTISALTTASTCSFKSIPIDMLSFDYVSNCDSPEALQQIVDTLSADGSKHYPSLLRKAKQQLESINKQTTIPNHTVYSVHFSTSTDEQVPRDSTLYVSSTKDESSLVLSLSSSVLDGASVDIPVPPPPPAAAATSTTAVALNKVSNAVPIKPGTLNPRVATNGTKERQRTHTQVTNTSTTAEERREAKLLSDLEKLTEEVNCLKYSQDSDNSELQRELNALREEKNEAEKKLTILEKTVLSSSSHARQANEALANVREEAQLLKDLLTSERNTAQLEIKEVRAIEEGLRRKVQTIAAQLARCKEQNADIAKSMESRFRRQVEKECAERDGNIRGLQQSLTNAQTTVKAMQEERSSTLRSIHQALGKSTDGVERLSAMERKATVDSLSKKLNSAREAAKALSKARTNADLDRKKAIEERDTAKKQLVGITSKCRRLQQENDTLTKRLQDLSDELESSKAYIDYLLQRENDDNDWREKEKEYQEVICNLKAQVRSGEASVSLALYRKAVDEARARTNECHDKKLEINTMSRKLHALEERLKHESKSRPTPLESRPSRVNLRKVSPTSSVGTNENFDPKTPTPAARKQPRPLPPPLTPRMSALREAGGRAGLCAKLKQMRRSPLVKKN